MRLFLRRKRMKRINEIKKIKLTDVESNKSFESEVNFVEDGTKISEMAETSVEKLLKAIDENKFRNGHTLRVELPEVKYIAEYQMIESELKEQLYNDLMFCA